MIRIQRILSITGIAGNVFIDGNHLKFTFGMLPYSSWAQTKITGIDPLANATPTGDPDGDGLSNSVEFAL